MNSFLKYRLTVCLLLAFTLLDAQETANSYIKNFTSTGDIFGTRYFIENKGQYDTVLPPDHKILFAYDHNNERIYFTQEGIYYHLIKNYSLSERDMERQEEGEKVREKPAKHAYIKMSWPHGNTNVIIEPQERQGHYLTFGTKELNSYPYKKLIYKNVYPNIDIEYTLPENEFHGIKYSLVLHPGADLRNVKILYSGDVKKIKLTDSNCVIIKTQLEDIIEHAPVSFDGTNNKLDTRFLLNKDTIGFEILSGYSPSENIIVDPWVTTVTTLTNNNVAYDVDYDFVGGTYIYGSTGQPKVAAYDAAGNHLWTFMGSVSAISWVAQPLSYVGNFAVDKFTGKTYIGQGVNNGTTGSLIVRIDNQGAYDNFVTQGNSNNQEVWDLGFHCTSAEVFVMGGGHTSNNSAATINTLTGILSLSCFNPLNTAFVHDIGCHTIDEAGNIFVYYVGSNTGLKNRITLVNSSFNGNVWTMNSTFTVLAEAANKNNYQGSVPASGGFNAMHVNQNYLYYYDGLNLAAFDKSTGTVIAQTTTGLSARAQGGIAVDDCDNIYVGGYGNILTYNFNGSTFTAGQSISLQTTSYVYDIKLNKVSKMLYVCGSGFVGTYQAANTLACTTLSSACAFGQGGISVTTTSITCASLGTATCVAVGGQGPYTYTWLPSMQTGSTATGLNPGLHSIIVKDFGFNTTYTASTYLTPLVALTGTVANPYNLDCAGVAGTVGITNFAGGSGSQTYLWTNGTTTQTTPIATSITPGNYTFTVIDGLSKCVLSQTFAAKSPPALTLNINANTMSVCPGSSVTLTPLIYGGTPNYTFAWSGYPNANILSTTQNVAGIHVYSLTGTDSKNCPITKTVGITFFNTPTLSVSSVSICPLQTGTLSVSGANSYTWNQTLNGTTFTDSPMVSTIYTVTGTGTLCSVSKTAAIYVKAIPTPTLKSNSPVCHNSMLSFSLSGGVSASWTGPLGFNAFNLNPSVNPAAVNNSGVYQATLTGVNSCTAAASTTVLIHPAPPVSATGATVCTNDTLKLSGSSTFPNCQFQWKGPLSFLSASPYPFIKNSALTTSGFYTLTVTDAKTCTSSAVVHATVYPLPTITFTTNSPLCAGATLSLNAGATGNVQQFSWVGPGGFSSALAAPVVLSAGANSSGVYILTAKNGPCVNNLSKQVIVYPLPYITISGNPVVCETETITLTAKGPADVTSYLWTGPGTTEIKPVLKIFPATIAHSGHYNINVTDIRGCQSNSNVMVTVNQNPLLTVSDVTVCFRNAAMLKAEGASTYLWSGPGLVSKSGSEVTVLDANSVTPVVYSVTGTGANNCSAATTMSLFTNPLPIPEFIITPAFNLCAQSSVTLTANGGIEYRWKGPSSREYGGKQVSFILENYSFSGMYTLTVSDTKGCFASATREIDVVELPWGQLRPTVTASCIPFCAGFTFIPEHPGSVNATHYINNKQMITPSFTHCFNQSGTFTVSTTLTDPKTSCRNHFEQFIYAYPQPRADFTYLPKTIIENTEPAIFTDNSEGEQITNFSWHFVNNSEHQSSEQSTSYLFPDAGKFPVALVVKNIWGCSDSIIKSITVEPDFILFVPNAFTPNSDNLNEQFKPVVRGVKEYHLSIFNRWGALLFESNLPENGWDGTFKGEPCKNDVYVWKINATGTNGEMRSRNGQVTLNK